MIPRRIGRVPLMSGYGPNAVGGNPYPQKPPYSTFGNVPNNGPTTPPPMLPGQNKAMTPRDPAKAPVTTPVAPGAPAEAAPPVAQPQQAPTMPAAPWAAPGPVAAAPAQGPRHPYYSRPPGLMDYGYNIRMR